MPLALYFVWQHPVLPALLVGLVPPLVVSFAMLKWTPARKIEEILVRALQQQIYGPIHRIDRSTYTCSDGVRRMCPLRFKETRREIVSLVGAFLSISSAALAQTQAPQENQIQVEIAGLRNDKGQAVCDLFSSAPDFPKKRDKAVAHGTSVITNRHAVCEFSGVAPGTYAISVFHDENSNGKLDTSFMGIPREGVGASNGGKGHLGPPKFDAAAFRFAGGLLELKITITYL
jgi:uncharacterized protein (DUF2141 family)